MGWWKRMWRRAPPPSECSSVPALIVKGEYPGNYSETWVLLDEEWRLRLVSNEKEALMSYASEIANGRPTFVWDDDGIRQFGIIPNALIQR